MGLSIKKIYKSTKNNYPTDLVSKIGCYSFCYLCYKNWL